jgi:hypothetical protein
MANSGAVRARSGPKVARAVAGEGVFAERFRGHEGPYHLYDVGDRPLIRSQTGARVLGALLEGRTRLVFLDDPGAAEGSVLKMTYPAREWLTSSTEAKPCSCGDVRCMGRLVITLHDSYAGPDWMLTFRG